NQTLPYGRPLRRRRLRWMIGSSRSHALVILGLGVLAAASWIAVFELTINLPSVVTSRYVFVAIELSRGNTFITAAVYQRRPSAPPRSLRSNGVATLLSQQPLGVHLQDAS